MARLVCILTALLLTVLSAAGESGDHWRSAFTVDSPLSLSQPESANSFQNWDLDAVEIPGCSFEVWDYLCDDFNMLGGTAEYTVPEWPANFYKPEMMYSQYLEGEPVKGDRVAVAIFSEIVRSSRLEGVSSKQWEVLHKKVNEVILPGWFPYELKSIAQTWLRPERGLYVPSPLRPNLYVRYRYEGFRGICLGEFNERKIWFLIQVGEVGNLEDFRTCCERFVRGDVLSRGNFQDGEVSRIIVSDNIEYRTDPAITDMVRFEGDDCSVYLIEKDLTIQERKPDDRLNQIAEFRDGEPYEEVHLTNILVEIPLD